MHDRRMTFILVPHEDVETRSVTVSYRRLKALLAAAVLLVLIFLVMASTWWYVASQAARVRGLEAEVRRLESERARVAELARTLQDVEAQYERVRQMLGADGAVKGKEPILPPLVPEATGAGDRGPAPSVGLLPAPGS